ncbi:hypothetical protein LTS12_029394, partial [Elasticomyces elasticus]
MAYAVPVNASNPPGVNKALESLRTILPDYMIPQLELIPSMPINNHGKVDRKGLTELYCKRWAKAALSKAQDGSKDIRSALNSIWATVLGSPTASFEDDDDFFNLGGTSLQASLLISQIRRVFGCEVSLLTLYDGPTIQALYWVIQGRQKGQLETVRNESDVWLADTHVADGLPCPAGPVIDWTRDTEGRIFFTGATGFVGAFMLADLLRMPRVHQIGCLVRAKDAATGLQRLRAAMAKYNLWEDRFADKLLALPGLLEDEFLGLGPERFDEIANWASVVFHLGAR